MDDLSTIRSEALGAVSQAADLAALEVARVAALGKKGSVTGLMKTLGGLAPEERREFGARVNQLKGEIEAALEARKGALSASALSARLVNEKIDVSLPARPEGQGSLHPIGQVMDELAAIFGEMGFTWADGPDIEDDWHNFTALNIPPDHPARQMQDTFYLPPRPDGTPMVLRTHTSPVQARTMLDKNVQKMLADGGSLRIIVPGRTFRIDNDATHTPMFHQVEGPGDRPHDPHGPSQGLPGRFLPRLLRGRRPAAALPPLLLPLHRTVGRGRYRLLVEGRRAADRRRRLLAGDPGLGHGPSQRDRQLRARSRRSTRASPSAWASTESAC